MSGRSGWSELRCWLAVGALLGALPAMADGWRAAPVWGADVRSLAADPFEEGRLLAGTSSGQVYASVDGGASWSPSGARVALPGWVVSDLVFDPHRRDRVWAAVWSLWGSSGAVMVSVDGGRRWERRDGGLPDRQVYAVALARDREGVVYAATRAGVWGSDDEGRSWRHLTAGRPEIGKVTSLLVDPWRPEVVYAGTWRRAYRSDDRGRTWRGIFDGMVLDSEVFAMVPGPAGEGELWASTCGWVYRGRDRGRVWRRYQQGMSERRVQTFAVLPGGRLMAGTVKGVFVSDDDGASWSRRGPRVAVTRILPLPGRPGAVLVAGEGSGVWRSADGGETFVHSAIGMVGLRVADAIRGEGGLAIAVHGSEGRDGVHHLDDPTLSSRGRDELPPVLDLAAGGDRLLAATEEGLWQGSGGVWRPVEGFGERRLLGVDATGDWIVAFDRDEVLSLRGGELRRFTPGAPVAAAGVHRDRVWVASGGRLLRWDLDAVVEVPTPGAVGALSVAEALRISTPAGWHRLDGEAWRREPLGAHRLLATGDPTLPTLAVRADGSAALLGPDGGERSSLRLPVPWRDVSAAVVDRGRLHLATAGYGLLWSNLVTMVADAEGPAAPESPAAVSSR